MYRRNSRRGLTLLELTIVGTVAAILGGALFAALAWVWNTYDELVTLSLLRREARAAMDLVCDELKNLPGTGTGWSTNSVQIYKDANGRWRIQSLIGVRPTVVHAYTNGVYRLARAQRQNNTPRSVYNVSGFSLTFEGRVAGSNGNLGWTQWTDMAQTDSRISKVATVYVGITTSSGNYSYTLNGAVKVRQQWASPPQVVN